MAPGVDFDVLVIGSGASGLAAAVSAERAGARVAVATKGSLQANNSSKAQGGIQAAFAADDSPEQHAEDVWRSSHETADRRLVEILTSEAPSAIRWLEELGVEFTRENGGYRLARCGGASRKRLLQVGDRTGHAITRALRERVGGGERDVVRERAPARPRARPARLASHLRRARDRRRDRGPGRGRPVLRGGAGARRALDQPSERDRRGDPHRRRARRRVTRPRCAAVPPERRRLAGEPPGLLDPRDDARLRRGAPERRRRGVHRLARATRRRRAGDRRRGRRWARASRRPTAARPSSSTRRGSPRPTPRCRCRTCCAATAAQASTR